MIRYRGRSTILIQVPHYKIRSNESSITFRLSPYSAHTPHTHTHTHTTQFYKFILVQAHLTQLSQKLFQQQKCWFCGTLTAHNQLSKHLLLATSRPGQRTQRSPVFVRHSPEITQYNGQNCHYTAGSIGYIRLFSNHLVAIRVDILIISYHYKRRTSSICTH